MVNHVYMSSHAAKQAGMGLVVNLLCIQVFLVAAVMQAGSGLEVNHVYISSQWS